MNSISKSRESWARALLPRWLLALGAILVAQGSMSQEGTGPIMHWQARHPDVAFYEDLYRKESARLQAQLNRSAPFIHFILAQLQLRKLPPELVFIPLIESGYSPYAESPAGAVGPWQLMPKTAQQYGVTRHDWFDGRKDLLASTRGALNYLSYLHSLLGRDWHLALAAYNAGEGTVQRAMAQNSDKGIQTDFWSLSLPKETRQYVPKLLALVRLYRAGQIQLPALPEASRLTTLHVEDGVSLAWLAKQLGQSKEELNFYNAGLENAVVPCGCRVALLLPTGWCKHARQVLGARSQLLPLPAEKVSPELRTRRSLADEELRILGWGVGLMQQAPGTADLHVGHLVNPEAEREKEQEKGRDGRGAPTIAPHWRPKIAPLNQWGQVEGSKTTGP